MKLTKPQAEELKRLARFTKPQSPQDGRRWTRGGGARHSRVQNSLREKGLVRLFNADGHTPSVIEILTSYGPVYDSVEITDAGRALVKSLPRAPRWRP